MTKRSVKWWEDEVLRRAVKFSEVYVTTVGYGAPLARAGGLLNEAVEQLVAARKRPQAPPSGTDKQV